MARLLVGGDPRFEVDAIEIDRGGLSYTVDTLADAGGALARRPSCSGSSGPTCCATFAKWREPERIVRAGDARRAAAGGRESPDLAGAAGTAARRSPTRRIDISSTEIRAAGRGRASRFEGSCRTPSPPTSRRSGCTDRGLHVQASHQRRLRHAPRARAQEDPADRRRDQRALRAAAERVARTSCAARRRSSARSSASARDELEARVAELKEAEARGGRPGRARARSTPS